MMMNDNAKRIAEENGLTADILADIAKDKARAFGVSPDAIEVDETDVLVWLEINCG